MQAEASDCAKLCWDGNVIDDASEVLEGFFVAALMVQMVGGKRIDQDLEASFTPG